MARHLIKLRTKAIKEANKASEKENEFERNEIGQNKPHCACDGQNEIKLTHTTEHYCRTLRKAKVNLASKFQLNAFN